MLNHWIACSQTDNPFDSNLGDSPVNFQILEQLYEVVGHEIQQVLIQQFLTYAPQQIEVLQQLVMQGDAEALRCKAHQFKGECAQLGACHLATLCKELEILAKANQLDFAAKCLTQLQREANRVNQVLTQVYHHDKS